VGEFTTVTSNYDAEYSQAGGAVILVQTKAGTNEYHGNAFEFLQNNISQARDPFTQGLHPPGTPSPAHRGLPELRWNQFGGSLGGKSGKTNSSCSAIIRAQGAESAHPARSGYPQRRNAAVI
jgi:hypothetical protein